MRRDVKDGSPANEELWPFALEFYGLPAVQEACLTLQDEHGADVNVVLCMLWLGHEGTILDENEIAGLDAAVKDWRVTVVRPLRAIRRALKNANLLADGNGQEAFRSKIKAVELQAERLELGMLEARFTTGVGGTPCSIAARRNLEAYLAHIGRNVPRREIDVLLVRLETMPAPKK